MKYILRISCNCSCSSSWAGSGFSFWPKRPRIRSHFIVPQSVWSRPGCPWSRHKYNNMNSYSSSWFWGMHNIYSSSSISSCSSTSSSSSR